MKGASRYKGSGWPGGRAAIRGSRVGLAGRRGGWSLHLPHVRVRRVRARLRALRWSQTRPGRRREERFPVPGMNSGLSPDDPTLVAAFRSALLHQSAIALLIVAFLWLL